MTETLHTPRPSELVEAFLAEAISNSPQPLKDLAEFLSNALSEDDWNTADRLLLALSLRNRTSEPEAGFLGHLVTPKGGDAVFVPKGERIPLISQGGSVTPIYDGPQNVTAPATADKLREAAGLLNDCIWLDTDTGDYRVEHDGSVEKARAILAALNEQPQ